MSLFCPAHLGSCLIFKHALDVQKLLENIEGSQRFVQGYGEHNTTMASTDVRQGIRSEFASTAATFHTLLDSLSEADIRKKSNNPGWTNGEILFHMAFGFFLIPSLMPMVRLLGRFPKGFSKAWAILLNFFTIPFNWINAIAPRIGGRIYAGKSLGKTYDWVNTRILKIVDSVNEDEWDRGIYVPTKWDALFSEYMTLKEILHFPIVHFQFHLKQISR